MSKVFSSTSKSSIQSFTLVELIIVVIIVGILASLGLTQYSLMVEKSRTVEARVRLGTMRQLAYEFYLSNGDVISIQNADVGVNNTCASTDFYRYLVVGYPGTAQLQASRCTNSGKPPNASRGYTFYVNFSPGTGVADWYCGYSDDSSSCFGLPGA